MEEGQTLSVVGGDVDIAGSSLAVDAGRLHVLAANGPAEADVATGDLAGAAAGSLTVRDGSALVASGDGGGAIRIEGGQFVVDDNAAIVSTNTGSSDGDIGIDIDVQTADIAGGSLIATDATAAGDGGDIDLKAETIEIVEGARLGSSSSGDGDGGDIAVVADSLTLNGSDIATATNDTASGDGGDISIAAGSLELRASGPEERSLVAATSFGSGAAGDVNIRGGSVLADGGNQLLGASIQSLSNGEGSRGGQIRLIVDSLDLVDGGFVFGESSGGSVDSSSVEVIAKTVRIDGSADTITGISLDVIGQATPTPGAIVIQADDIDIRNDGEIASNTGSANDASEILITADTLSLSGEETGTVTQISSSSELDATGNAGRITIIADAIELSGNAAINSAKFGEGNAGVVDITANASLQLQDAGLINTSTFASATGNAGSIVIDTAELTILDAGVIISATFGSGDAGAIDITADTALLDARGADQLSGISTQADTGASGDAGDISLVVGDLTIRNSTEVSSTAFGTGNAGTIDIALTDSLVLERGADIATRSASAGGGRVTIGAGSSILVVGPDSEIATTVADDTGDAGDIAIETPLLALGDADILARADAGRGGDIQITADDLLLSPEALISAEAGVAGIDGTVAVSAPEADLTGGLAALDGGFLDVSSLLRERCTVRRDAGDSSFTLGTGGSLPADLDAPQPSLLETGSDRTSAGNQHRRTIEVIPCPTPSQ